MRVLVLAGAASGDGEPGAGPAGAGLDATVPLRALLDRLAHARTHLPLPPERVVGAAWAGISPPRQGWLADGALALEGLRAAAAVGARRVAAGVPRTTVWSGGLGGADAMPLGAALVADVLGFLVPGAPAGAVARCGPWWRLTTVGGHVLARRPLLLG